MAGVLEGATSLSRGSDGVGIHQAATGGPGALVTPMLAIHWAEMSSAIALSAVAKGIWNAPGPFTHGTGIQTPVASMAFSHELHPQHISS